MPSPNVVAYAQDHGFPAQSSDYANVLAALENERKKTKEFRDTLADRFNQLRTGEAAVQEREEKLAKEIAAQQGINDRLASVSSQMNAAQEALAKAKQDNQALEQSLTTSKQQAITTNVENEKLASRVAAVNEQLRLRLSEISKLQRKVADATAKDSAQQTALDNSSKEARDAQEKVVNMEKRLIESSNQYKAVADHLTELQEEMSASQMQLKHALNTQDNLDKEIFKLKKEAEEGTMSLKQALDDKSSAEKRTAQLESQAVTYQQNLDTSKSMTVALDLEILELQSTIRRLNDQQEQQSSEIAQLTTSLDQLRKSKDEVVSQRDEMARQVTQDREIAREAREREHTIVQQLESVKTELNAMQAKLDTVEEELIKTTQSLATAQSDAQKFRATSKKWKKRIKEQDEELIRLQASNSAASEADTSRLAALESELSTSQKEADRIREDAAASKELLDAAAEREISLQRVLNEAKKETIESTHNLSLAQAKVEEMRSQITKLKDQLASPPDPENKTKKLAMVEAENERLQSKLSDVSRKLEEKTAKLTAFKLTRQFQGPSNSATSPAIQHYVEEMRRQIAGLQLENAQLKRQSNIKSEGQRAESSCQAKSSATPISSVDKAHRAKIMHARNSYGPRLDKLPRPARPAVIDPVQSVSTATNLLNQDAWKTFKAQFPFLYLPHRTICGRGEPMHMLAYAPTKWYLNVDNNSRWIPNTALTRYYEKGRKCELFVNQGSNPSEVRYAGTYKVIRFREAGAETAGPEESEIPWDIPKHAIYHAMGVMVPHEKIEQDFAGKDIRVEVFGLQCVGFDVDLYRRLRAAWTGEAQPTITTITSDPRLLRPANSVAGVKRRRSQKGLDLAGKEDDEGVPRKKQAHSSSALIADPSLCKVTKLRE
ncbi:hypothetical protein MIND_00274500 [Mycena indigotica]|uniref:Uncharacterized protein n=1 Tax=Mycena indigotica TaxID=2126181 RepID=A0A8H6T8A0_9AGAR|nr:uncharacterized protein MIND_00274500 [Mycena indigotica]KAF7312604.1 hypothetical protein MIND_00274500 [Mycena indigotica]